MDSKQAELLLRQEVKANSAVGQALVALLESAELENYRVSAKTADPYITARICGRGEGINSILNRITPTKEAAPKALPASPAGD